MTTNGKRQVMQSWIEIENLKVFGYAENGAKAPIYSFLRNLCKEHSK